MAVAVEFTSVRRCLTKQCYKVARRPPISCSVGVFIELSKYSFEHLSFYLSSPDIQMAKDKFIYVLTI